MVFLARVFAINPALVRVESQPEATFDLESATQNKENERVQESSKCRCNKNLESLLDELESSEFARTHRQ